MFGCDEPADISRQLSQIQLLQVGAFHGDEVSCNSGEVWFGMYSTADGYELKPTAIKVEPIFDPIVDGEDQKTGKQVFVEHSIQPLILIKGLDALKAGRIQSMCDQSVALSPGKSIHFAMDEDEYRLTVFGEELVDRPGYVSSIQNYEIRLSKGRRAQVIISYQAANNVIPRLLWAGDLDRDKKLDLLIDAAWRDDIYTAPVLFLSSLARGKNLVQEAATFSASGC
jgi:hypothetical protein